MTTTRQTTARLMTTIIRAVLRPPAPVLALPWVPGGHCRLGALLHRLARAWAQRQTLWPPPRSGLCAPQGRPARLLAQWAGTQGTRRSCSPQHVSGSSAVGRSSGKPSAPDSRLGLLPRLAAPLLRPRTTWRTTLTPLRCACRASPPWPSWRSSVRRMGMPRKSSAHGLRPESSSSVCEQGARGWVCSRGG